MIDKIKMIMKKRKIISSDIVLGCLAILCGPIGVLMIILNYETAILAFVTGTCLAAICTQKYILRNLKLE